jgi:hypothetical protein
MNDHDTLELRRIVANDPGHAGPPDLPRVVGSGRRRLARRRAIIGGTALGAVAAIVVPAVLVAGGGGDRDRAGDVTAPASALPKSGAACGQLVCVDPTGRGAGQVETAEVIGEWVGNDLGNGAEEVLYVARPAGTDLSTGEPATVDVVMLGYRFEGELHRLIWSVQPGTESTSPQGNPSSFYLNVLHDTYSVVGFVEGTPESITWSTPVGDSGTVDGLIADALPGYTLFHLTQPLPDNFEPAEYTRKGDEFIILGDNGGNDSFPPALTIHTSDGWSCSIRLCGAMG